MTYQLTPRSRDGLRRIAAHVNTHFGARTAEPVLDELFAAFELLARSPGIGHTRSDLTKDATIRFWVVAPTLIAYRRASATGGIEVLFVERGERDGERLRTPPRCPLPTFHKNRRALRTAPGFTRRPPPERWQSGRLRHLAKVMYP